LNGGVGEAGIGMADQGGITLSVASAPGVDAPRAATSLARELVREGVPVTTGGGPVPEGGKSGIAITAGSLVISGAVSAQVIRSVTQVLLAALRRGSAGRIALQDGDRKFEVENASRDTERALVAWLTESSGDRPNGE
jgi:hypothetical protein